ncbi:MAG: EamA-like transporter family protein [Methanomassiliicoccales archaeon PtaU1.Bin030]|nr:MAG: EamA-like transporter family protein [Methanomassiliicoccales archaeon PtaU1.Bin030]
MKVGLGKHELLLIASGILWGTSFVTIKIALNSEVDPIFFALLRFLVGTAAIMAVVFWMRRFDAKVLLYPPIIFNSFLNALSFALQNVGMESTSATNSVLLVNTNIGVVAILAAIFLAEAITPRIILGIALGLVGVLFISTDGDLSAIYSGTFWGNLLVLAAGWVWAVYIVVQKKVLNRKTDVIMVTAAIMANTTLFLVPMTLLFTTSYALPATGWIAVVYIGLACTFGANLLYNAGLKGVKASISSVILLMEVVSGMVFAMIILGEMPTAITAMGGLLVLLSILIISLATGGPIKRAKPSS